MPATAARRSCGRIDGTAQLRAVCWVVVAAGCAREQPWAMEILAAFPSPPAGPPKAAQQTGKPRPTPVVARSRSAFKAAASTVVSPKRIVFPSPPRTAPGTIEHRGRNNEAAQRTVVKPLPNSSTNAATAPRWPEPVFSGYPEQTPTEHKLAKAMHDVPAASPASAVTDPKILHVGGINGEIEDEVKLEELFTKYGAVEAVTLRRRGHTGKLSWALVEYAGSEGPARALADKAAHSKLGLVVRMLDEAQVSRSTGIMRDVRQAHNERRNYDKEQAAKANAMLRSKILADLFASSEAAATADELAKVASVDSQQSDLALTRLLARTPIEERNKVALAFSMMGKRLMTHRIETLAASVGTDLGISKDNLGAVGLAFATQGSACDSSTQTTQLNFEPEPACQLEKTTKKVKKKHKQKKNKKKKKRSLTRGQQLESRPAWCPASPTVPWSPPRSSCATEA
eukprot:COSAG02_NODE_1794_length_10913_cov_4.900592_2_plen_456_part_00